MASDLTYGVLKANTLIFHEPRPGLRQRKDVTYGNHYSITHGTSLPGVRVQFRDVPHNLGCELTLEGEISHPRV